MSAAPSGLKSEADHGHAPHQWKYVARFRRGGVREVVDPHVSGSLPGELLGYCEVQLGKGRILYIEAKVGRAWACSTEASIKRQEIRLAKGANVSEAGTHASADSRLY